MASVNGRIHFHRQRWSGEDQTSHCPIDRLVDDTEAAVSVGVRQLCCREGTNARSFARGRENLHHAAQIDIGEEQFRQLVEGEGKAVLKACSEDQLELDWSASDCKIQTPQGQQTTRIYVSADGVMVPTITQSEKDKRREKVMASRAARLAARPPQERGRLRRLPAVKKGTDQRYKQVYVTAFYDQDQKHRLVGVTRQKVAGLKRLLRREAARVHLRAAAERVGMVDGAVCLRNNLEDLPLQEILLDFYHFTEHVAAAGAVALGNKTEAMNNWLRDKLETARHKGYTPLFEQLMEWRSTLRGAKRQAADALIKYVAAREEMIRYEECDKNGWNIGSGPMESMCGVTTDRIKGRGRRWDLSNAEAMMGLESLYQSTGLWDRYWANVIAHRN